MVFHNRCHPCTKNVPLWLPIIFVRFSNDIQLNPGPQFHNRYFNLMLRNVNSFAEDNFQRVSLIEAHNSIFNYYLIFICETSLNDLVELPDILLHICSSQQSYQFETWLSGPFLQNFSSYYS